MPFPHWKSTYKNLMHCHSEWSTDRITRIPFSAVIIVHVSEGIALTNYARWSEWGITVTTTTDKAPDASKMPVPQPMGGQ